MNDRDACKKASGAQSQIVGQYQPPINITECVRFSHSVIPSSQCCLRFSRTFISKANKRKRYSLIYICNLLYLEPSFDFPKRNLG